MKTKVDLLTHDDIAEIGARWLKRNGYPIAISNYTDAVETELPDAIGFTAYGESFLLEAKVSVSDFKADFKKRHRQDGAKAYGNHRGYITPKDLLDPKEIPYGWWLLEVHGKNKPIIKVVKGIAKEKGYTTWDIEQGREGNKRYLTDITVERNGTFKEFREGFDNVKNPASIFLKLIRRAMDDGIEMEKYANGKFKGGYKL
ncbi:MAG: hypothetical protein KTR16_16640 [Acidiferrobacterales bacterium]|nr:hypothetical protein [Acidiferrobacterales bacterium]